ncbi:hypothetical protein HT747_19120 [Brevibacillus borstelensis]|jgi:hypothetical protein|uniref:hypothetical protein n=1 Tax=Brevibacillus TaxID=55080 RepID=UPI00068B5F08|nr:hypothetical protein [Brevibacillus borstelensis]MBE5397251.1 hypothetical protein [Brevibacillus borstelensis]MED1873337.1 hypothetical protein [Brevibacillus borstelensis]MED2010193.1 hypothetical protein [Brevibacillus borstelensis]
MKSKNIWIVMLFLVGAISLTMVEGYLKPEAEAKEEQYRMEQRNPLTHDFENVLPYKHKYMGDAGNLGNLNYHLPLSDIPKTFQLFPEAYALSRAAVEKWYGVSFADLQEKEKWNQIVRDPLADASYVERFFTQVVKKVE